MRSTAPCSASCVVSAFTERHFPFRFSGGLGDTGAKARPRATCLERDVHMSVEPQRLEGGGSMLTRWLSPARRSAFSVAARKSRVIFCYRPRRTDERPISSDAVTGDHHSHAR